MVDTDVLTAVISSLLPIKSSNKAVCFFGTLYGTLFVKFHGGQIYAYEDVPVSVYAGLMAAESKGSYFARKIERAYSGTMTDDGS